MKFKDMSGRTFNTEAGAIGSDAFYVGVAVTIITVRITGLAAIITARRVGNSIKKIGGKISEIL